MKVPLTINDFLDRAVAVYPDRLAIVDEPDQPAPAVPDLTYRELGERRRAMGAALWQPLLWSSTLARRLVRYAL